MESSQSQVTGSHGNVGSGAGGVAAARPENQQVGSGAIPTPALQELAVKLIPLRIAKAIVVRCHYLHSFPGGTRLAFGVFTEGSLKGVLTLGVGPTNAHRLVQGMEPEECVTLTRLWLSDHLPRNSESRVIGITLRALRRHTSLKVVVSYADPSQGHLGTIYQATNWLYTGLSERMPLYALGDGVLRHSRSFSHAFGTHSIEYFRRQGIDITVVPRGAKHRYMYLLDSSLRDRLTVPVLPYPKESTDSHGSR